MRRGFTLLIVTLLLAAGLTFFFYHRHGLPPPLHAAIPVLLAPVALATRFEEGLGLGSVQQTPMLVFGANFVGSLAVVVFFDLLVRLFGRH